MKFGISLTNAKMFFYVYKKCLIADSEQSPGVYLRDDPLLGGQAPHCELRVPTAEKAAHYLDAAVEGRTATKEEVRDSHLLFTLHVYQYSMAGKGGGKLKFVTHQVKTRRIRVNYKCIGQFLLMDLSLKV